MALSVRFGFFMKLKLHELTQPLSLSFSHKDGWLRDLLTRLRLSYKGPLSLHINIQKERDTIFIEGHIMATLTLSCSRCASDAPYKIDEFFSPTFVHGKEPNLNDGSVYREELDVTYFRGDEIDLPEILHEQIVLLLPAQPLCHEACKGLCPQCGQDLNVKSCKCKKENTHSRFSMLKGLKVYRKKRGS